MTVCLSLRQFGVFLRNGSLVFSDFWRDGIFLGKLIFAQIWAKRAKNGPKLGFFRFLDVI